MSQFKDPKNMTILTEHGYGKSHKGNIRINTFGANLTQGESDTIDTHKEIIHLSIHSIAV